MTTSPSRRLRLAVLALALSAATGLAGAQVFSQPDVDFKGSVRAASPVVLPGSEVELAGSGFKPGQRITLQRGETVLNAQPFVADAEGGFKGRVAIPADAAVGVHPVVVRTSGPDAASIFELKVSRQLPVSGQERFDVRSAKLAQGLYQVAYSAKNDALFVTSAVGRPPVTVSALQKVDPQSLQVVASVTPGQAPAPAPRPGQPARPGGVFAVYGVGVDDANGNVWVTNTRQNTVAVYRQSDLSLVKQFPVGAVPHSRDIVVDAQRGRVYATAAGENFISVFDAKRLAQLDNIVIESGVRGEKFAPTSLDLDPATGKLYTASMSTPEAAVIDTASNAVEKVIPLVNARSAIGVAWNPVGKRLLVVSQGSDNLLIVDPQTGTIDHDVYVGAGALNVSYEPTRRLAYVVNRGADTIAVVDDSGKVVANFDGGSFPNHVSKGADGVVYAVNKARGAEDPKGDHIRRIAPKGR
ncbi:YncE family protein [Luteimonas sp. FCS-9]|uniref:Vgb family protein n=1 Tax=Luteimonas sp. FCS-9 TaxID=1547516 RepID=UPI00063E9610|nr:YncE family protein [Luteimonas sp. FCS-9]KLJ01151.1 ATP-binding protein [Luteimonas sp. FCS-9]